MDDDVKNLFQKFGQSKDNYREINREATSEQAMQRWPLLRDVHIHAAPEPQAPRDAQPAHERFPARSEQRYAAPTPVVAPAPAKPVPLAHATEITKSVLVQATEADKPAFPFAGARAQAEAPVAAAAAGERAGTVGALFAKVAAAAAAPAAEPIPAAKAGNPTVSNLLGRLAAKPEVPVAAEVPSNSFFKRMFKP